MEFTFNKGYLCCGCLRRFIRDQSAFVYKRNCICKDCFAKIEAYPKMYRFEASKYVDYLTPILRYKGLYRDIFLDFKFRSNPAYGHLIGKILAHYIKDCDLFSEYSYIVTVPASKTRMNERGYNQTEIMAGYVSEALNIPIKSALVRVKHSMPQSKARKRYRKSNVKDAFACLCEFNGENIILFDDVYTTGSTMSECTKVLRDAGSGGVCAIAGGHNHSESVDRTIHMFYN